MSWRLKVALWLLGSPKNDEERNSLVTHILDNLGVIPLRDIIQVNDRGEILINNVLLGYEDAQKLKEGAIAALKNQTMRLVWDQIRYECFKGGVSQGEKPSDLYFYRTALWNGEQERKYLRLLAGDATE